MQDLIVALYDDHSSAARVRTELVKDGFPTDRIELTSLREHGQADVGPATVFEANVRDYFRTLNGGGEAHPQLARFTQAVIDGAATLTVHPRGEQEIQRAQSLLAHGAPREIYRYLPQDAAHIADRKIERAAMPPRR